MPACWFILLHHWRKIWWNTLIIHLDQTANTSWKPAVKWNKKKKKGLFQILTEVWRDTFWWQQGWKVPPLLISLGQRVSLSSHYICLSFLLFSHSRSLSHTHTSRAADPVPLCGLLTCSQGHGWLKQWQVDSTLKLSIDPRELNQTSNPPSLSVRARSGTKGEDAWRVRGQAPPLHPHCAS